MTATAPGVTLRPATPADIPELGRICYEAFKDLFDRHGFPLDFTSAEVGVAVMGLMIQDEQTYSVAGVRDGTLLGSNHIEMWDEVAGVGPVSVDVGAQGEGLGRRMMEDGIAEAQKQGFDRVRLCQDSFNMQSLALYASLGFEVVEPLQLMQLSPAIGAAPDCRTATPDDLDAMDELTRRIYRITRKNEIATIQRMGIPVFVSTRDGRIAGYLVATPFGHGVAEDDDVMLRLLATYAASVPDALSLVPIRNGELYRTVLAAGHRNRKPMNLMALGSYEPPVGTWLPSVLF
jgi:predicted N-acetyltransferase YhbS